MTVETAPNFAYWTSTQAGVRWLVRNFIRWPLFLILLIKIWLQRCSWHISIHQDAFRGFLWCSSWPVLLILWRIDGYIHQIMIIHCKGQLWCRQSTRSGGHHRLSTVGLPGQSWWSLYQRCQQWSHEQLIHQDIWQISWALQEAYSDRLGAHFFLLPMHGNGAGHSF